ncbi:hypothetical protein FQA39_LY10234 [Lamprigera yunnana]|nr:hypothetical protein FQA39_LY10234 [Lamprigera yunnana]
MLRYKKFQIARERTKLAQKIPGPRGIPIFGNALQMLGYGGIYKLTIEHLWNFYETQSLKYYPIYKVWIGSCLIINLVSPEDIQILLSSKDELGKSRIYNCLEAWLGTGLLTSKGGKWQYRRKLLTPAFHFGILQDFAKTIIEQSEILVEKLKKECDKPYTVIDPIVTQFTLGTICETAMGTKLDETQEVLKNYISAVHDMGHLILDRNRRPWLSFKWLYYFSAMRTRGNKIIKILHNFTRTVIKKKKIELEKNGTNKLSGSKRKALLDLLLTLKQEGAAITDEGIREEVDTFMFEGHDTTSSGLTYALLQLSNYQHIQEKVWEEISEVMEHSQRPFTFSDLQKLQYLEMVIKECLRIYPSVPLIARRSQNEIATASGYKIPPNAIVHIHIYGVHHNPNVYPEPEKFDPERFSPENSSRRHPFAFIPFSAGPRNCIGQRFALLELKVALASIVRNYKLLPVDDATDVKVVLHIVFKRTQNTKIQFKMR